MKAEKKELSRKASERRCHLTWNLVKTKQTFVRSRKILIGDCS